MILEKYKKEITFRNRINVMVKSKKTNNIKYYKSIADCARNLNCDRKTLYNFLWGKWKNSCLEGLEIKIIGGGKNQ